MNKIDLIFKENGLEYEPEEIRDFCLHVLDLMNIGNWEFSLVICGDDYIRKLNADYRKKDEATDILTFRNADTDWISLPSEIIGSDSEFYAGDMVISMETLIRNAEVFKVDKNEEFKRLIIHGILHLAGLDHETNNPDEEMLIKQEDILKDSGDYIF